MRASLMVWAALASVPAVVFAQAPVPNPTVMGPIVNSEGPGLGGARTGKPFLADLYGDLAAHGYVEEEYFISGTARDFGPDRLASAPYTTRILVRRPIDPGDFNGTVLLEWFNTTSTYELDVDWSYLRAEILRSVYVYVGVSAQVIGVQASPTSLKEWDPVRYALLEHPGDPGGLVSHRSPDYSLDMFAQAAQAVRRPGNVDPLGGLPVQRVLASGHSQSATKLNQYLRSVRPEVERVIDGFFISGDPSSPLLPADLDVPVIRVSSEWEAVRNSTGEADHDLYRLWETAGSIHASKFQADYHGPVSDRDFQVPAGQHWPLVPRDEDGCLLNRFPKQYGSRAALDAFDRWVRGGAPPPMAPRITQVNDEIQRDEHGNALGGIRTPAVEVPIASYNNGPVCGDPALGTYGRTDLFDETLLRALYPTHADYFCAVQEATQRAVRQGFLLRVDAEELLEHADAEVRWPEDTMPADCDGDAVPDLSDNCPFVANPGQTDSGGIASLTPDGIGDACQCGDVTGDGVVSGQDGVFITRHGLGYEDVLFVVPGNCDVTGNGVCNGQDGFFTSRAGLGFVDPLHVAPRGQNCPSAAPSRPPEEGGA